MLIVLLSCHHQDIADDYVAEPDDGLEPITWDLVFDAVNDADRLEVLEAAGLWRQALAGSCPVQFSVYIGEPPGVVPAGKHAILVSVGPLNTGQLGWTWWYTADVPWDYGARIVMAPNGNRESFRGAAKHELGHAFKLDHAPTGVMQDQLHEGVITLHDVELYGKRWCP